MTILPELPRVTPDFSALDSATWDATVDVASGGDINAGVTSAVALINGGKKKVQIRLAAGGTYTMASAVQLTHYTDDPNVWIEITTSGWNLASGTRVTPALGTAQNVATLTLQNDNYGLRPDPGANGWSIRGIKLVCNAVQSQYGFISLMPSPTYDNAAITTLTDFPNRISIRQIIIQGNAAPTTRRFGVRLAGQMVELTDSWIEHVNFGGVDYGDQSQAFNYFAGGGKWRVENNFLWRACEGSTGGGAGQSTACAPESFQPEDITIRRNHYYVPFSVKQNAGGTNPIAEGSANGTEMKQGRRVLFECNIVENVWDELQPGFGLVAWSAEYGVTWTQNCDWTVRYNWFKNTNCAIEFPNAFTNVWPDSSMAIMSVRMLAEHNLFTGLADATATTSPFTGNQSDGDGFLIGNRVQDVTIRNNTEYLCVSQTCVKLDPTAAGGTKYTRLTVQDNIMGTPTGGTIFVAGTGSGDAGWAAANDGTCVFSGNVCVDTNSTTPTGNTVAASLAAVGFADGTGAVLTSTTTKYADLSNAVVSGANAGKGCDVTTLITKLSGVETAAADLPT